MLYEIISPDAFLRPYIEIYATLSAIYAVVAQGLRKDGLRRSSVPDERRTSSSRSTWVRPASKRSPTSFEIDEDTIELIKQKEGGGDNQGHQPDQEH